MLVRASDTVLGTYRVELVEPQWCWAWTRPGSGDLAGCPTARVRTAGSGGPAPIHGGPGLSTSRRSSPVGAGRRPTSAAVRAWLAARSEAFRAGIEVVVSAAAHPVRDLVVGG